jgi:hypothetical protein
MRRRALLLSSLKSDFRDMTLKKSVTSRDATFLLSKCKLGNVGKSNETIIEV